MSAFLASFATHTVHQRRQIRRRPGNASRLGRSCLVGRPFCSHAVGQESEITVRVAAQEELWAVADLHVTAFYSRSPPLLNELIKLDRVLSILEGKEHDIMKTGTRYVCLVAKRNKRSPSDKKFSIVFLLLPLLKLLLPPEVCKGIGLSHQDMGIYGGLNMDTTGINLPSSPITLNGRRKWKRETGCGYVSNLAVTPDARGKGIGKMLVNAAEHVAASWGCWCTALHCEADNKSAYGLYNRLGYTHPESTSDDFGSLSKGHVRFKGGRLMAKLL